LLAEFWRAANAMEASKPQMQSLGDQQVRPSPSVENSERRIALPAVY
jgi:hypothetical protein